MTLLTIPLATLLVCIVILVVNVWIGYAVHKHQHYDRGRVTLRQRLRHPATPASELERERSHQ